MNKIKVSLAAAALFVGLGAAGASAMPMNNLSGIDVGAKLDQVRMVCDQWGRCWWRPNYYSYGTYGYYGGSRYYGRRGGYYGGRSGGRHRR
jgi:hypothetical protein